MRRQTDIIRTAIPLIAYALVLSIGSRAILPQAVQTKYEDSPAGLKHFAEDFIRAIKSNDSVAVDRLSRSLEMPEPTSWFADVFGDQSGRVYVSRYDKLRSSIPAEMQKQFSSILIQQASQIDVVRFTRACDLTADEYEYAVLAARQKPEPLYRIEFRQPRTLHYLRILAYVDGAFRYVGDLSPPNTFASTDGGKPVGGVSGAAKALASAPVQVSEPEQSTRLVHRVSPRYPDDASWRRMDGSVKLHVLIGEDGSVERASVLLGTCMFSPSAVEAVRKWKYSPLVVNGKPVKVDTTVDLTFAVRRRF